MGDFLFQNKAGLLDATLWGGIIVVALWELLAPKRQLEFPLRARWLNNIGITALNILVVRWGVPILATSVAFAATRNGWGLLNQLELGTTGPILVAGLLLTDAFNYLAHRMFHALPWLWRLHAVHHADPDMDFTTASRHHPLEVILQTWVRVGFILVMGIPAAVVLLYELLRTALDSFNHGNIQLPAGVEKILRTMVITPDFHRVHHSAYRSETDSNFSALVPWWDWLFGTYCPAPRGGQEGMTIGLEHFRNPRDLYVDQMLLLPFQYNRRTRPEPAAGAEPAVPQEF